MSFFLNFSLFLSVTFSASSSGYFVDSYYNCNNVYNSGTGPENSNEYVTFLGLFNTTEDCINACILKSDNNSLCQSYTYHTSSFSGDFSLNCFGRFGYPLWTPVSENNINCGRIIWNCNSDLDCSLNGKCNINSGNCTCRIGWSGYKCDILNLLPTVKDNGYNYSDNGTHTSSWGGGVVIDDNSTNELTKYHMFLSQLDNHCGIHSWIINSKVVHAQSTNGLNGPFKRIETIHSHFAHEPDIIRGNNGEYVIYYSSYDFGNYPQCECFDGSTTPECSSQEPPGRFITYMQYSHDLISWTIPEIVIPEENYKGQYDYDNNLAGIIKNDGSFLGMWRFWNTTAPGSQMYLCTANNWKNKTSYIKHETLLFPELVPEYTEDQFLYVDCDGYYHAIFHNMSPNGFQQLCGGHAYSIDGVNWIYGGYIYNNNVTYSDGSVYTLQRRERPHFIFDSDDKCTPIALTNGVTYNGGAYGDASSTFLQPIKH